MNLNPVITQQFNNGLRSSLRFYFSRYEYEQTLLKDDDKSPYYHDFFSRIFIVQKIKLTLICRQEFFKCWSGYS
jgi:hypothetical protein